MTPDVEAILNNNKTKQTKHLVQAGKYSIEQYLALHNLFTSGFSQYQQPHGQCIGSAILVFQTGINHRTHIQIIFSNTDTESQ